MIPSLHIHLLGDFLLVADDTPVATISSPRLQSLLAYLLLHRDAPQSRSHLAFLLWPDSTEAQAHTNLRQLLHHLRQDLPHADQFLHSDQQNLQWLPVHAGTFSMDVIELEQALIQAAQAEQDQDIPTMRQALVQAQHLYSGDLLPSCYEEWILPERDRLRQLFLQSAERLIALAEQERDYETAITVAQRVIRADPLHEVIYCQLMRLYALHGNRAAALRTYHTCAKLLERELRTKPSEITQTIYESLMHPHSSLETHALPRAKQRTEAPLQGRKAEWRRLQKVWNMATSGIADLQTENPLLVLLSGEAGIGKTRLAQELEGWVSRLGMSTASARCYAALGHLAYAPVTSWLRSDAIQANLSTLDPLSLTEIARLLPEILVTHTHLSPPAAITQGWQLQHFFAALTRAVLSVRQPLLLLLDDLHWCDHETLEWLQYLFHFAPDARLLLIGTMRAEELPSSRPLATFLGTLQRDGLVTEIPLEPLTMPETASLAEYLMDGQLDLAMQNTLYQETEGNPFFVVEMIRTITIRQDTTVHPDTKSSRLRLTHATAPLPSSVQAMLTTRLAQLSTQAHNLANIAAIIGREFSFSVLAHASGESEEHVVEWLDELWQKRIVREHDAGITNAYDFSHDKLREQISTTLSPARRRLLHQRVAEAFKAIYREDQDTVCGQIAAHYEQAGLPTQAIPWYQRAGEIASRIYAHTEALHAFERAAALVAQRPGQVPLSVSWETVAQVYISLGDVSVAVGSYEDARQAYLQAITYIPGEVPIWRARLHWKIAIPWIYASTERGDAFYNNGWQAFEEAEYILTHAADRLSSDWRNEWIALQFAQVWQGKGTGDNMLAAIEKARPIVEQHGTQEQRKLLLEAIGIHNAIRDRYVIPAHRIAAWRATIAAMVPTENEAQRGIDLAVLGIGLLCASQFDDAEEQLRQALRLGERTGNAWVLYNCLTFLPFVFRHRRQVEEMRCILAQAQSVGVATNNRILSGHAAWLAWCDDDLILAKTYGRESVEKPQPQQLRPNPFLWTGRWPLIGVALMTSQTSTAINDVRLLFDPMQQPPLQPLDELLEAAVQAWEAGKQAIAHELLLQTMPLAKQMGYL